MPRYADVLWWALEVLDLVIKAEAPNGDDAAQF